MGCSRTRVNQSSIRGTSSTAGTCMRNGTGLVGMLCCAVETAVTMHTARPWLMGRVRMGLTNIRLLECTWNVVSSNMFGLLSTRLEQAVTSRPRQRSASTAAMWKPMRMTIATPTQKKMRAALHDSQRVLIATAETDADPPLHHDMVLLDGCQLSLLS